MWEEKAAERAAELTDEATRLFKCIDVRLLPLAVQKSVLSTRQHAICAL